MIVDEIKTDYINELIKDGKRADERGLLDYREIKVTKDYIPNADGSALVQIGDTKALAGVKFNLMKPFSDRPDEGVFMVNSEFCVLAHPEYYPGPPRVEAIELSRVVDRGIRSAECIDVKKFYREEDKVLGIFVDLYILDNCGNLQDASALAAMAALKNTKVPKYEDGAIVRGEYEGPLELARSVASCTFEQINGKLVLDATEPEEIASEGRMTWGVSDGDLACAGQKSGRAGLSKDDLMQTLDIAIEKSAWLRSQI